MFKRVERKRKRLEEDEELGLDQDTKEMIGLDDIDTDESDSDESAQLDDSDGGDVGQEEDAASEDEEGTSISVAEALNDPIYLISLDPTLHGCVLCKGKLIKNTGMATAHANANAHKRRLEHFKLLSNDVDARSSAWELVKAIRSTSNVLEAGPFESSKRALKRQAKQATLRDKRKRHRELKARAIARNSSKKPSTAGEIRPAPSVTNLRSSVESQVHPGKPRKKKLGSNTPTTDLSASPMKASRDNRKLAHKSKTKNTRKMNKLS